MTPAALLSLEEVEFREDQWSGLILQVIQQLRLRLPY